MKVALVNGKSWWVPASRSWRLAVQIETEDEYLTAIEQKLLDLIEARGPFAEVLAVVTWIMEPQGLRIEHTNDPKHLIAQVLATSSIGEMVRAGAPWMSAPAPPDEALEAIEGQHELTLEDFLG